MQASSEGTERYAGQPPESEFESHLRPAIALEEGGREAYLKLYR